MRAASLMLAGSVLSQYGPVLANMCDAAYRLLHFLHYPMIVKSQQITPLLAFTSWYIISYG